MSGSTNLSDRFERTRNPATTFEIYAPADLGIAVLAPDGIMRVPLVPGGTYSFHNTIVCPRLLWPKTVSPGVFDGIVFIGVTTSSLLINHEFEPAPADTPHMWGRSIGAISIEKLTVVDISNGGVGGGTVLWDIEGGNGALSVFLQLQSNVAGFKRIGNTVDVGLQLGPLTGDSVNGSGWVSRFTAAAAGNSHSIGPRRFLGSPFAPDNRSASLTFIGLQVATTVIGSGVELGKATNSFLHIDSGTGPGSYSIVGQNYTGPASGGTFFRPDEVAAITSQIDASIAITSFSDSAIAPGVDTTVNFGGVVDVVRGQVVLIADEVAYDGSHVVIRVADDQASFDISVVHSTSGAGTMAQVEHTVVACKFVRDETVTITGTASYDGVIQIVSRSDTSFVAPQAFVGDDASGTATSTGKDQTFSGVQAIANGAQEGSTVLGEACWNGSGASTAIADGAYGAISAAGVMIAPGSERVTLTDAATSRLRNDSDSPIRLSLILILSCQKAGASPADYRIAVMKNGAPPVFATAPYARLQLRDTTQQVLFAPTIVLDPGDEVQPVIAGDGHTTSVDITDGEFIIKL